MEIKINQNSWHVRCYELMYGVNQLPNNLCAYFWKAVLAVLLYPVFFILELPKRIIDNKEFKKDRFKGYFGNIHWLVGICIYVGLFCIYCMIAIFFIGLATDVISPIGVISWLILVVVGIMLLVEKFDEWRKERKRIQRMKNGLKPIYKEDKPNIIVEYFKAWKGKYCPKITFYNNSKPKI